MYEERNLTICRLIYEFSPSIGGSITHTIELSKNINQYCKNQFLIVPKADVDTAEIDRSFPFRVCRVKYFKFKWLHIIKDKYLKWLPLAPFVVFSYGFFAMFQIYRLNRQYGIDIIHAHGVTVGVIATIAGKLLKKPVVWMMHGTGEAYSAISGKYETIITKLFPPDHLLVLDDGSKAPQKFNDLMNGKVSVVYHGIDSSIFCPRPSNKHLLHSMGLNDNMFIILSAHSLIPVKGMEHAFYAFRVLLKNCSPKPDTILLIAGDGSLRAQLEALACELCIADKVLFLGRIDSSRILDYISISDIAIATSTYSNMNRSVQEAMSCGKPVVAFNSGGTGNIIKHMETGILAKSGDVNDLAEKMLLLYNEPELRKKIGENARKFIIENRSWESRIKTEFAVYEKVLKARRNNKF